MTYIFAGNAQQARFHADRLGLRPSQWRYVTDYTRLHGNRGGKLIRVGTWYDRSDVSAVMSTARMTGMEVADA